MITVDCTVFREHTEELALGTAEPELRSVLMAHASRCASCQQHLDELALLADQMLELVTPVEPPEGFETRVLERLRGVGVPVAERSGAGRLVRPVAWAVAVAAVVVAMVSGVAIGEHRASSHGTVAAAPGPAAVVHRGVILRADGNRAGTVELRADPVPHILVLIPQATPGGGTVSCELALSDGTSMVVGTWGYDDIEHGVWSVGIDNALLAATTMRIRDADGNVLASAWID